MKSLFTGIDSSSHTAVSSAQVIYSFFLNLFIYFIVIANIFFYKSIAWSLLSRIPYSFSVSVSMISVPFPDSGFRLLVLPESIAFSLAPFKGMQDSPGFWILSLGFRIPKPRIPDYSIKIEASGLRIWIPLHSASLGLQANPLHLITVFFFLKMRTNYSRV